MTNDNEKDAAADEEAARWYARLGRPISDEERERFAAWVEETRDHREAWARVRRADALVATAGNSPELAELLAEARAMPRRRSRLPALAAAAALCCAVGGAGLYMSRQPPAPVAREYATALGERRTVRLADGSRVTLDTGSHVRFVQEKGERRIALLAGQAFFRVAKDRAHPFVVKAGDVAVTALGTAFDVRADAGRTTVALIEGTVRVDTPALGRATILHPGMRLVASAQSLDVGHAASGQGTEWMAGRVTFDAAPLSSVAAEMNRYSARRLVLADPRLGQRPVSGVFRTGDVDAFAAALEAYRIARIERRNARAIRLTAF